MELISWSLNAIDKIFSTRSSGSGEPICPDGTFAAGYTRDSWEQWRIVCLAILSLEDIEDIYLFGFMIAGHLLIGLSIALVYRKIGKTAATQAAHKLPIMLNEMGRAVSTQTVGISELNRKMDNFLEKLTALQDEVRSRSSTDFRGE